MKNNVVVIVGPTASGKSAISVEIAKVFNGEIISGDSMQVYKELNIGSAKITKDEMQNIPHHLINVKSYTDSFSAGEFSQMATAQIKNILSKNKTPIIVGGTGLFIQGIVEGYDFSDCSRNQKFRDDCKKKIEESGLDELLNELKSLNSEKANQISSTDEKRIIRALEIEKFGVKHPSKQNNGLNFIVIGLDLDRNKLYDKINKRVDKMIQDGLVDEVKQLYNPSTFENLQSMKGIGYKELIPYLENKQTLDQCIELIKQHTRNYAKRQLTWFRHMDYINWFSPNQTTEIIEFLRNKL